jgi:hypothetical protein
MKKETSTNGFLISMPFWGIGIFFILYVVAAFFYPGGSQYDKAARAFSWTNNYWCDLLTMEAKNGQYNTARPIAVTSWVILCCSLSLFWYYLPVLFLISEKQKKIISISGIAAMAIAVFLFTSFHDIVIQAGGLLGLVAFAGTLSGLYKTRLYGFFYTGLFCVMLMGLNYFIMVSANFSSYLPVVQKFTFVIVLLWILIVYRKVVNSFY